MGKLEFEAKIEYQNEIGESSPGSYKTIKFNRIKYKGNNETFIDIRKFQRGYDSEGNEEYHPTKIGFQIMERSFAKIIKEYTLTPKSYVHPKIIKKSFSLLNSGEFESAVFQAFKCLEVEIRQKIEAEDEEIGVKLIRKAFHAQNGLLTDFKLPVSEREAFSNYIAGAFGFYKNPCSHRDISLNFITAFDRIVVASDLLKIVDKSNKNEC